MRRLIGLFIVATVLLAGAMASASAEPDHGPKAYAEPAGDLLEQHIEGAERLEGRLLAPCCWDSSRQTIDIHGSPIALQLRREIRTRLKQGQTPETIEADLVARYGEKILAVPPGNPLRHIGTFLTAGLVAAGVGAALMLARWKRRADSTSGGSGGSGTKAPAGAAKRDEWDERLDQELDSDDD